MRGALRQRPFLRSERIKQLRLALLIAGLSGDIAQEFAAVTYLGDRERRRQHQVGIVFLLRLRMMLQMIAAIGARLGENRIGAEPLAQGQIGLLIGRQASMRAVMHQDGQSKLARADDADRQHKRQRIGPPRDQRDRAQYQRPGVRDHGSTLPRRTLAHGDQLILGQKIAGPHAKRGHDEVPPSGESETDASPSSTTRSRVTSPAVLVVACSPSTRSISAHSSSAERPIA